MKNTALVFCVIALAAVLAFAMTAPPLGEPIARVDGNPIYINGNSFVSLNHETAVPMSYQRTKTEDGILVTAHIQHLGRLLVLILVDTSDYIKELWEAHM